MATNFWGAVYCSMAAIPHMRRRGFGRIGNVISIGGKLATPHLLPYTASKFALAGFTEALRSELARDGILVTGIYPHLMRTGGRFGFDKIEWFNGGLFDEAPALPLKHADLIALRRVAGDKNNWAGVEPSIFGTLFERILDPKKRAQIGAHYTSKADILLVVEPVVMTPLRRRWQQVQDQFKDAIAKHDAEQDRKKRDVLSGPIRVALDGFRRGDFPIRHPCRYRSLTPAFFQSVRRPWPPVGILGESLRDQLPRPVNVRAVLKNGRNDRDALDRLRPLHVETRNAVEGLLDRQRNELLDLPR